MVPSDSVFEADAGFAPKTSDCGAGEGAGGLFDSDFVFPFREKIHKTITMIIMTTTATTSTIQTRADPSDF